MEEIKVEVDPYIDENSDDNTKQDDDFETVFFPPVKCEIETYDDDDDDGVKNESSPTGYSHVDVNSEEILPENLSKREERSWNATGIKEEPKDEEGPDEEAVIPECVRKRRCSTRCKLMTASVA
ncbi:uncharacterized protein [Periplaneta americana]|uniref:uncharacterized protein isoform X3 n=1 Tax=Periplaneta americana TaxID=6978 RepID=UPI0037E94BCD